jgi:AraC-like DNA-binding protein
MHAPYDARRTPALPVTSRIQRELIDAKIRILLCAVAGRCHNVSTSHLSIDRYREEFTQIRNLIFSRHGQDVSVPELIQGVNLSESYFHYIYKNLFRTSIGRDVIRSRIEYACNLLKFDNFSVAEVAFKCQYLNVEHFIRQFKQYMQCTPGEYQKEN